MKRILFTKEISTDILKQLNQNIIADSHTFLKIRRFKPNEFESKINSHFQKYLISSQNAVEAIKDLNLDGDFYVVGTKTSQLLQKYNFNVKVETHYAKELADFILRTESPTSWNFFCGNNRRDELSDRLIAANHNVNEIIVYESVPNPIKLDFKKIDGIAFMSPLGVKSFFKSNSILPETIIFSIGTTTADEAQLYCQNPIVMPEVPTYESMVQTINNYFNVKK